MTDVFNESSRLLFGIERVAEETIQAEASDDGLPIMEWAYVWCPRFTGLMMAIASLVVMKMAWKRQQFVFHRLILGMSIHQLLYGVSSLIGNWAIPRDVDGHFGSVGTWGTCTAQGFFIYVCARSALGYYGLLSIYSYVGVLSSFKRENYKWCEKWIHISVTAYPIVTGVYYLTIQGYNPAFGICKIASHPFGCDRSDDVVCERGPASTGYGMVAILWIVPALMFGLLPTIIMVVLYFKVKKRERDAGKNYFIRSRSIAIQSCVYLFVLYWTFMPFIVIYVVGRFMGVESETLGPYIMAAQMNVGVFTVCTMLVYRYFSIDAPDGNNDQPRVEASTTDSVPKKKTIRETVGTDFIFNAGESLSRVFETTNTVNNQAPPEAEEEQYTFNIFDGTNASGAYSDFIHGGDSEDERMDEDETDHWNAVQNHI